MTFQTLPPSVRDTAERVLTEKQLEVLKLHLAGMTHRNIARALNIAPSTVDGRLFRARQKMSLALEQETTAA